MKLSLNFQKNDSLRKNRKLSQRVYMIGFQLFLLIVLAGLLFSCKVYRPIDQVKPALPKEERSTTFEARQIERIQAGDKLYLVMKNGTTYDIAYSRVENDSIKGLFLQKNNRRIKNAIQSGVPFIEIETIKIEQTSAIATAGLVLGFITVSYLLIASMTFSFGFIGI